MEQTVGATLAVARVTHGAGREADRHTAKRRRVVAGGASFDAAGHGGGARWFVAPRPHVYAVCWRCWRNAVMTVQITIRGVPDAVRNELAARAALQRQSMQEFLLGELERIASRPTIGAWLQGVRDRKAVSPARVTATAILRERDADRR